MQKPFMWVRYSVAGNGAPRTFVSQVLDLYTVPGQVQGRIQQAGQNPGALSIILASFFLVLTLTLEGTVVAQWVRVQDCTIILKPEDVQGATIIGEPPYPFRD